MEITLVNYMEACVAELLPAVIDKSDICKCDKCRMDIMAYALNHLPPKYVATRKGHMYAKLDAMHTQFSTDIITALSTGMEIVGANPRHE